MPILRIALTTSAHGQAAGILGFLGSLGAALARCRSSIGDATRRVSGCPGGKLVGGRGRQLANVNTSKAGPHQLISYPAGPPDKTSAATYFPFTDSSAVGSSRIISFLPE